MADHLTPAERSRHMARIRKVDTRPERVVRRLAHRLGARFRLHRRDLPGCPDLVFPRRRLVIFVHGCFWHQHPACRLARQPKSRTDYWLPKLRRNVERDMAARAALLIDGWRVEVVWECETQDEAALSRRLAEALDSSP